VTGTHRLNREDSQTLLGFDLFRLSRGSRVFGLFSPSGLSSLSRLFGLFRSSLALRKHPHGLKRHNRREEPNQPDRPDRLNRPIGPDNRVSFKAKGHREKNSEPCDKNCGSQRQCQMSKSTCQIKSQCLFIQFCIGFSRKVRFPFY